MIHAEPTVHAHDNSDITLSLPMGSPMASKTDPSVSLSSALTHTSNAATPAPTRPLLSPAPASLSLAVIWGVKVVLRATCVLIETG